ncbi:UDP-glucose--hexose-1-phosphate uridylyltransferase [Longirhabdus pacifica]|uniref:UDP-glucose--hexose-1-phosphate uridylyltransferase n=1 Tax=Longirhabdus pacifica TaxID=2305227 RepID=UPI001008D3CF|nr:UDP-glucose--hexose-1-phosphate uridylyltransferase [Longirhabdus pacifica]
MNIYSSINRLLQYGVNKKLLQHSDVDDARNRLLHVLQLDEYDHPYEANESEESIPETPVNILADMLDWAFEHGLLQENTVTYRDLLDTALMACLMPRPSEVNERFFSYYENGPKTATNYFYQLSHDSYYIRTDRVQKNEHWLSSTDYGDMEITINLSKPEKDPKAIAAAKRMKQSSYPKCLLCKENVGYGGRVNHPSRQNHRIIPLNLGEKTWYLQYSPYVYFNEHAIVFSKDHEPMKISKRTFDHLLHFVDQFPHYFVGSNADLPIVGGSILTHDHFQGGHHEFPMAKASTAASFTMPQFETVEAGRLHWPMSVIRITSTDRHRLSEAAAYILQQWQQYSDETVGVMCSSGDTPHHTITPIARHANGKFEMDLVLRNNRTSDEHPLGIFHPHAEVHHIKKENIGLIEVMGLAVLPGRLKEELTLLGNYMLRPDFEQIAMQDEVTAKHVPWAKEWAHLVNEDNVTEMLQQQVGQVFSVVLEHAGVFKQDQQGLEAFDRFLHHLHHEAGGNKHEL